MPRAPRGVPGASRRGARGARRAARRGAVVQRRREERRREERRREERLRSDFVCLMRFILIKNENFDSSLDLRSRRSGERREERGERREEQGEIARHRDIAISDPRRGSEIAMSQCRDLAIGDLAIDDRRSTIEARRSKLDDRSSMIEARSKLDDRTIERAKIDERRANERRANERTSSSPVSCVEPARRKNRVVTVVGTMTPNLRDMKVQGVYLTVGDRAICPRPLLRATQSVPRACIFDLKLASASASA